MLYSEKDAHQTEYTAFLWHKAASQVGVICVKRSLSANQINWSELIVMLSSHRLANLSWQLCLTLLNGNSSYNTVFLTFCFIKNTIEKHCSLDLGIFSRSHFIWSSLCNWNSLWSTLCNQVICSQLVMLILSMRQIFIVSCWAFKVHSISLHLSDLISCSLWIWMKFCLGGWEKERGGKVDLRLVLLSWGPLSPQK